MDTNFVVEPSYLRYNSRKRAKPARKKRQNQAICADYNSSGQEQEQLFEERGAMKNPTNHRSEQKEFSLQDLQVVNAETELGSEKSGTQAKEALKESQRRLSMLISNLPGIAYRCRNDRDRTMEFISEGCVELTGYQVEDILLNQRLSYAVLVHPEDRQYVWEEVQAALQLHAPFKLVYRIRTADGKEKWAWEQGRGVFSQHGELLGLEGFIADITDRKKAEQAVISREAILDAVSFAAEHFLNTASWEDSIAEVLERLGRAIDVSRVYIFENHIDSQGRLCMNQRYEWAAPDIPPQIDNPGLQDLPYREAGAQRWEEMLGKGQSISGHIREFPESERLALSQQDIRSILVVPVFVKNLWWGFIGFDACWTEREWTKTEIDLIKTAGEILGASIWREEVEAELRNRTIELDERNAELDGFIFAVSHDLRTPLISIEGFSKLLKKRLGEKKHDHELQLLERIHSNVMNMRERLDDLLALSRPRIEQLPAKLVDLNKLVSKVLESLSIMINERKVAVIVDENLPEVFYQEIRLRQVMTNLIENAVKFMGEQSDPRIRISNESTETHHKITVSDNGMGISPESTERIFEIFHRLPQSDGISGTGIGLALVRRIVEMHNGRIWVDSTIGQGSAFHFTIPRRSV
jgi:PAS domain S-box-containing protein